MSLSYTFIYCIMDLKYQVTIAASSCFIGLLAGIFIIRIARRTSRRKSPFDHLSNDSVSTEGRRHSDLDNRRSLQKVDHQYMRQPNDKVSTRTHVEFETFSYPKPKHNNLHTNDDVYQTLSNDMTTQLAVDPPADYPVTPVISRQVSMPVCPVAIPPADYSDDETLVDYPITRTADTKPQATKHHHLKRTTSYPVMNHSGRNPVTRRSERHYVTRYSDSQHDMILPNTKLFPDSRFQTQTGHPVTNPPTDTRVNIPEHQEAAPLPDYPGFGAMENVPLPDYC